MNSKSIAIAVLFSIFIYGYAKSQNSSESEGRIFTPVEDLRISDSEENFLGEIGHIAIGPNNEIYIADNSILTIHKYDPDGSFLMDIGREGRGPGEFLVIGGMRTYPDGRLVTLDQRNSRINIYTSEGEFLTSHIVKSGLVAKHLFEASPDGSFFVKNMITSKNNSGRRNVIEIWYHISDQGKVIDTLTVPNDPGLDRGFHYTSPSGSQINFTENTLSRLSSKGYLVVGTNSKYEFELRKPSGTVVINHEYTPVQIKPDEKKQWENTLGIVARQANINQKVPDTKPPFKDIFTDSEGRIWIHRYTEADYSESPIYTVEGGWWEAAAFDIFLDDGSFYGSVKFPHGFNFSDARGDHVYGVLTTDDLAEHVVRYTLSVDENHN